MNKVYEDDDIKKKLSSFSDDQDNLEEYIWVFLFEICRDFQLIGNLFFVVFWSDFLRFHQRIMHCIMRSVRWLRRAG